jgi:phosphatidylinositol glycan class A protein
MLEAASAGLYIVATNVGGIVEVLPKHMVRFANPNPSDIVLALGKAIPQAKNPPAIERHRSI